jgi:DHA2 family multidrug resistance protein
VIHKLEGMGLPPSSAIAAFGQQVQQQAIVLATEHVFQLTAIFFVIAAATIWLAPRPPKDVDTSAAH